MRHRPSLLALRGSSRNVENAKITLLAANMLDRCFLAERIRSFDRPEHVKSVTIVQLRSKRTVLRLLGYILRHVNASVRSGQYLGADNNLNLPQRIKRNSGRTQWRASPVYGST